MAQRGSSQPILCINTPKFKRRPVTFMGTKNHPKHGMTSFTKGTIVPHKCHNTPKRGPGPRSRWVAMYRLTGLLYI